MEKRALGKGLSALIPQKEEIVDGSKAIQKVSVDLISNNSLQPRKRYNAEKLRHLKDSIKEKGVLQPILIRKLDLNSYEVVAGERRLRAARELSLTKIPVIIKDISDQEAFEIALIENIQREELNAVEEAQGYKRLIEEFGHTQEQVAKSVSKDRSTITNLLRVLNLPEDMQESLALGQISLGHARALLGVEMSKEKIRLWHLCIDKGISVRELEKFVKMANEGNVQSSRVQPKKSHEILALEDELSKALGTKVNVLPKKKKGKIVIEYYSLDDLDRILGVMRS